MNAFFGVVVEGIADAVRPTAPRCVTCVPNMDAVEVAGGGRLEHFPLVESRHAVNGTNPAPMGALFTQLLRYRACHHSTFAAAAKKSDAHAARALAGNVTHTSRCTWRVERPEPLTFDTSTAEEELVVVGWAWGVALVAGVRLDAEHARAAIADLRRAATVFHYLRMRAPGEMTARFQAFGPVCSKAYVCAAYQALALALAHVAAANIAIAACTGKSLDERVPAMLHEADQTARRGLTLLKNEDGADDAGLDLPETYARVWRAIHAAARFYVARLHAPEPALRQLAHRHMVAAADLAEAAPMRAGMRALADVVETLHAGTVPTSLAHAFARLIMPRPSLTSPASVLLAGLDNLQPLPDPDAEFEAIEPPPVEALIFPPRPAAAAPAK